MRKIDEQLSVQTVQTGPSAPMLHLALRDVKHTVLDAAEAEDLRDACQEFLDGRAV